MPTVEQNRNAWDKTYGWKYQGEEWSVAWGGSEAQWHHAILPRIHLFVPAGTILEIAPGQGRWTHYLKGYCERLTAVDLSARCVEVCKERFASCPHVSCHVNDGYTLPMVPDESVDFAFSFDSLVHAESDVIGAYLQQLAKKLRPSGVGFIHHSNMGAYFSPWAGALPQEVANPHWRATTVSAGAFAELTEKAGLQCLSQEIVNWLGNVFNDCFSVFTRKGSKWARPMRVIQNPDFMREVQHIASLSKLYCRPSEG